jgi:GNAT superfamily N-acetyltransferase
MLTINRYGSELPPDLASLLPSSIAEQNNTVRRIGDQWVSGEARFAELGEILLLAHESGLAVGVGGITRDPHRPDALRMRRFYVHPAFRRRGIGRQMAVRLHAHARANTLIVALRAGSPDAARFWERLGFVAAASETQTHELRLSP